MTRLQVKDLTPEMLAEVCKLNAADDVVKYFADKGFEVSPRIAERILEQSKKGGAELSEEALAEVAGGCGDNRRSTAS